MVQITYFAAAALVATTFNYASAVPVSFGAGFPGSGAVQAGPHGGSPDRIRPQFPGKSVFRREYDSSFNQACVCRPDIMDKCICGDDLDSYRSYIFPGASPSVVAREIADELFALLAQEEDESLATTGTDQLASREETAHVVVGPIQGGSPFGSIPSKILQFAKGIFGGLFGKREETAHVVIGPVQGGSPFGSIPSKLIELAGGLFGGLFGKRQLVGGISTVTETPFGSIVSKIGKLFGGLFGKREETGHVVIGQTQGGSPFGSIPSKLIQFAKGIFGGLFGKRQMLTDNTSGDKFSELIGSLLFPGDSQAATVFSREFVDAMTERCICRPDIPDACVCGGPASLGLQRPSVGLGPF